MEIVELDDLSKKSDIITIHVPKTDSTVGLFDLDRLKMMKPTAQIINCARGGIIDENALLVALNDGIIFGAGLDVFSKEPPKSDNPLLKNKKVLLTPHAATFTKECISDMAIQTAQNIIDFFDNKLNKSMIVKL